METKEIDDEDADKDTFASHRSSTRGSQGDANLLTTTVFIECVQCLFSLTSFPSQIDPKKRSKKRSPSDEGETGGSPIPPDAIKSPIRYPYPLNDLLQRQSTRDKKRPSFFVPEGDDTPFKSPEKKAKDAIAKDHWGLHSTLVRTAQIAPVFFPCRRSFFHVRNP